MMFKTWTYPPAGCPLTRPTRFALIAKVEGTANLIPDLPPLSLALRRDQRRPSTKAGLDRRMSNTILSTGYEGVISPGGFVLRWDFGGARSRRGRFAAVVLQQIVSPLSSAELLQPEPYRPVPRLAGPEGGPP